MQIRTILVLGLLPAFALGALSPDAPASTYENDDIGYRLRLPEDFESSGKGYRVVDDRLEGFDPYYLESFRRTKPLRTRTGAVYFPVITTYYFPARSAADVAKERAEREKAETEGDKKTIDLLAASRIYRSFKEYASERMTGFYFSEEETLKVAGFPVTTYEMSFEKLTGVPRTDLTCCFTMPDGEFAILGTSTEEHFDEMRAAYRKTFASFKPHSDAGLRAPARRTIEVNAAPRDPSADAAPELSAEEQVARRNAERDRAFQAAIAAIESGGRHVADDDFLVIFDDDARTAKRLLKHVATFRQWLADEFGFLGIGVVPATIIRLQKVEGRGGGRSFAPSDRDGDVRTFTVFHADGANPETEFLDLNRGYLDLWFSERNESLWKYMPLWVKAGLNDVLENAHLAGSKLDFDPDGRELGRLRVLFQRARDDKSATVILPLREVVGPDGPDLLNGENALAAAVQATSLVRYLLAGPGAKRAQTKSALKHYLGHLLDLTDEIAKQVAEEEKRKKDLEATKGEMSEEQRLQVEDEEYKRRRERSGANVQRDLLEKALAATFGGWDDGDWKALDRAWKSFAEKLAED